jgi:hypothetical protein
MAPLVPEAIGGATWRLDAGYPRTRMTSHW